MTTKHTPGPWVLNEYTKGHDMKHGPNIHNNNGKPYQAFTTMMDGTSRITFEACGDTLEQARQECDAMVAKYRHAPELLNALVELMAVAPSTAPASGLIVGIDERHRNALAQARDAIAKAKGTT